MNDMELAEEIGKACTEARADMFVSWLLERLIQDPFTRPKVKQDAAIAIAALRGGPERFVPDENPPPHARPPSGEMGYEEYHDGIIGVFKMNADGSRNLLVLTPQASEQFRAMIAAAEAEVRKPCPLCGRTDPHSHTSGPPGMS